MSDRFLPSDELLTRYLSGDCPRSSVDAVEAWIAASPDHARRLERLRTVLSTGVERGWDVDQMWARVRAETSDAPPASREPQTTTRPRPRIAFRTSLWRAPAAAALLIGFVGLGTWLDRRTPAAAPMPDVPDAVYETRRGQTATVQLSDGSRVRMAPESRLTVRDTYGDSLRELTLQGEAEFDVKHDAAHPFLVRTANGMIEDIGTRFSVRAYRGDAAVVVAVAEGAVSLSSASAAISPAKPRSAMLLRVGDLGALDAQGRITLSRGISTTRALAWTTGQLQFANRPLPEVLATIARWYDLDIRLGDASLAFHPVTAEFSTQSADEMLEALAVAVEATVERKGRHVTLRARP
jgi:transmembrane sensor